MSNIVIHPDNRSIYMFCKHGKIKLKDPEAFFSCYSSAGDKNIREISNTEFNKAPELPDYPRANCIDCMDPSVRPNVKIYILCHNEERLKFAKYAYGQLYWAVPILMKYQDVTFENAFFKQLMEIQSDWDNCEMVGVISSNAVNKMDVTNIDIAINQRWRWNTGYCNFFRSPVKLLEDNSHPYIQNIISDIKEVLGLVLTKQAYYANYWMCTPYAMKKFIHWSATKLIPAVLKHKLAFNNAYYGKPQLTAEECMKKFGYPYYPNVPFIIERLNACFFSTYYKDLNL